MMLPNLTDWEEERAQRKCRRQIREEKLANDARVAREEREARKIESGLVHPSPNMLPKPNEKSMTSLGNSGSVDLTKEPKVNFAFDFSWTNNLTVEDELKYFVTVLKVLEHVKSEVEHSTRKGVYQLIITHIDHKLMVDFLNTNPKFIDVLADFLKLAIGNMDGELFKVHRLSPDVQIDNFRPLEEECGMIMASYGNFLGSPLTINDDVLEKILTLFPTIDRWRRYWDLYQFDCVASLPFGVWANMTRDLRRCFIIVHMYEQEIKSLMDSVSTCRFHGDLKSLVYTVNNLTMLEPARQKFFRNQESLEIFASFINMDLQDCDPDIRKYLMSSFIHIAMDNDVHDIILDKQSDLFAMTLRPIVGYGKFSDDEMLELPEIVCAHILSDKNLKREGELGVRHACLQYLWHLSSTKKSREKMREQGVYYLLRELYSWEEQQKELFEDWETSDRYESCLDALVQVMIQTEEELEQSGEDKSLSIKHMDVMEKVGDVSRFVKLP